MKIWIVFGICGALVACANTPAKLDMEMTPSSVVVNVAPDMIVEIDARIELLSAVQTWTTWAASGAQGDPGWFPTTYYQELKAFLSPYQKGDAVQIVQKLQDFGFKYQGPPTTLLLCGDGLSFTPPAEGFAPILSQYAQGEQNLSDLVKSFRQLARDSQFELFFAKHLSYYQALAIKLCQDFPAQSISAWFRSFYGGSDGLVFHFLLAPAMMPAGGYGLSLDTQEKNQVIRHIYQIVRLAEKVDDAYLRDLGIHEFSHSFVNSGKFIPATARPALEKLYASVRTRMSADGYSTLDSYLNEVLIRTIEMRAHIDLGLTAANSAEGYFKSLERQGFFGAKVVYQILDDYIANRQLYPDFNSFMPVLLQRLADHADRFIAPLELAL